MKYRKWDSKTKVKIILEGLQNKIPLAELCNQYQISQGLYYYWLSEFQAKAHEIFESKKRSKKEQIILNENHNLKRIIADLTVELKKTEFVLQGESL